MRFHITSDTDDTVTCFGTVTPVKYVSSIRTRSNHVQLPNKNVFNWASKSILCQEQLYLLELVCYIHLNPIRAKIVPDMKALDRFPFTGHSTIMGNRKSDWQDVETVLRLFENNVSFARRGYRCFVKKGIAQGKRYDLTGGGLIRSSGGWANVKAMRKTKIFQKSDERILSDGNCI